MKKYLVLSLTLLATNCFGVVPYDKNVSEEKKFYELFNLVKSTQMIKSKYKFELEMMSPQQRAKYYEKAVEFGQKGMAELEEAEKITWYIPDVSTQEAMEQIVKSTITSIAAGSPYKAAMAILLQMTAEYAPKCMQQYEQMKSHMMQAECYFELSEFYLNIAKNG